eukprot:2026804-Amphidinium_carterae.1
MRGTWNVHVKEGQHPVTSLTRPTIEHNSNNNNDNSNSNSNHPLSALLLCMKKTQCTFALGLPLVT